MRAAELLLPRLRNFYEDPCLLCEFDFLPKVIRVVTGGMSEVSSAFPKLERGVLERGVHSASSLALSREFWEKGA